MYIWQLKQDNFIIIKLKVLHLLFEQYEAYKSPCPINTKDFFHDLALQKKVTLQARMIL